MQFAISARELIVLLLVVHANSLVPDCQTYEDKVFTNQPNNFQVTCGSNGVEAIFPCIYNNKYRNTDLYYLQWVIGNSTYNLSSLPQSHTYNGTALIVKNIQQKQNSTMYKCQLVSWAKTCAHRSKTGRLIFKKCSVPSASFSSWYDYKTNALKKISTNITRADEYANCHNITYKDQLTGKLCASKRIPASNCVLGVCSHTLNIMTESECSSNSNITVTVLAMYTKGTRYAPSKLANTGIHASNEFVTVSFDATTSSISLKFINQPKLNKKFYEVKYGQKTKECTNIDHHIMEGYLFNSNFISLELSIDFKKTTEICFIVMVNNGIKTVIVEGEYTAEYVTALDLLSPYKTPNISPNVQSAIIGATVAVFSLGVLIFGFGVILYVYFVNKRQKSDPVDSEEETNKDNARAMSSMEDSLTKIITISTNWKSESENSQKKSKIDKSTTFYALHYVTDSEDCLMDEFARRFYPDYDPADGFGYYELLSEEIDEIEDYSDVIVLNKDNQPEYAISVSEIEDYYQTGSIYVQSKSVKTTLKKGSKLLYCARSEVITAYTQELKVDEMCKEVVLMKNKIIGYKKEWIRYGYSEFTAANSEVIQPNQRIIVQKMNGDLVTGPGVRHLVMKGRGSDPITLPELNKSNWRHIFIQSKDGERKLNPGTKYLFCAMMERVRETVHYEVYDIEEEVNMAEFARSKIPGFKPKRGYGYYEFKQEEYLEPDKKVVLVDKNKRLYTGVGARFFCTGGLTPQQLREKSHPPPKLNGTKWEHMFIQSYSKKRVLAPDSKFLYLEY